LQQIGKSFTLRVELITLRGCGFPTVTLYASWLKLTYLIVLATVASAPWLACAAADQIVTLYTRDSHSGADDHLASLSDFVAWKLEATTLRETALYATESYDVSVGSIQRKVEGYAVWVSFFDVLGMRPILGRTFLPEEKDPGHSNVVILSYQLWQEVFDGDPAIVGHTILVNGERRTLVGVMPKSMDGLGPGRILTPFVPAFVAGDSHDREYHVIASIKAGATLAQVQAELDLLDQRRHRREPKYPRSWRAQVVPMKQL